VKQLAVIALALAACGEDGVPMKGDVTLSYGSSKPGMKYGTAVAAEDSPNQMLVQFGSGGIDCDTYLDVFLDFSLPDGTFLYFVVDRTPGTHPQASISVMKNDDNSTSINSSSGSVTIDAVGDRVTGSVTFSTTDDEAGQITASGSFDVKTCF
jgi:hypothetical protein